MRFDSFILGATKLNDKEGIEKMGFGVKEVMDPVVSAFSASRLNQGVFDLLTVADLGV